MRKHFSDIFQAIINLLEDEKNIDDFNIDYYFMNIDNDDIDFINIRINQFIQEIRGLSNNNFRVYIYIYIYIYIYMNLSCSER